VPIPSTPFLYFQFGGAMPGGERFAFGFHVMLDGVIAHDGTAMAAIASDAASRFVDLWATVSTGLRNNNAAGVVPDEVIVRYYAGGVLLASITENPTIAAGILTSNLMPNYCALVVTLHTVALTRSGRGRFYLPLTGGVMAAGGVYTSGLSSTLDPLIWAFLDSFNTGYVDESAEGRVAVLSAREGVIREALTYSVDNRPDTQRGRNAGVVATMNDSHAATVT